MIDKLVVWMGKPLVEGIGVLIFNSLLMILNTPVSSNEIKLY